MEYTQISQNPKYIDIAEISDFLRSNESKQFNLDGSQMQLIEEVAFLCVNVNFIEDVNKIRNQLLKKNAKLNIPATHYRQAESILGYVYYNYYSQYKKFIEDLIYKYKLLPSIYWKDKLLFLDNDIEDEVREAKEDGIKITKKEAYNIALEKKVEDIELELLDSIIISNKPFSKHDGYPFWANPYFTRKIASDITIKLKKDGVARLEIGFQPYATLPEMKKVLKDNYKKIQEYRELHLPITQRRDHRKDNLPKMIDAYMLNLRGDKITSIANFLDEKYGGDISFEGVNQLISRIKLESRRFNRTKQET